jgi:hypothetical protein
MMLAVIIVATLIAVGCGGLVWNNSRSVAPPSQQEIAASWEKSVSWLMSNRATILRDQNPALWWMIAQSAEVSGDSRLHALYGEFRREYTRTHAGSLWEMFFTP